MLRNGIGEFRVKNWVERLWDKFSLWLKPKLIMCYAIVGVVVVMGFCGYVLSEAVAELFVPRAEALLVVEPVEVEPIKSETTYKIGGFSGYTSDVSQTDGSPYITADGTDLRDVYKCVVANNALEFGTILVVEGIGVCEVHDRMNSRYGENDFDIYFGNDIKRAREFGRRELMYAIYK